MKTAAGRSAHKLFPLYLGILALVLALPANGLAQIEIKEASGITRLGERLIVVSDDDDAAYYEYRIDGLKIGHSLTLNDQKRITKHQIINSSLPIDAESVGVLRDGTVVALSERLGALLAHNRSVYTYRLLYGDYANRGLEGLAIRPPEPGKNSVQIAVLWEGGYPVLRDLPSGVRQSVAICALFPVVVHHQLARDKLAVSPSEPAASSAPEETIVVPLDMGQLNGWLDQKLPRGGEPDAFRFRAPDFVWHKNGFIVLLSSARSPQALELSASARYGPKVLQRFGLDGEPVGDPLDLDLPLNEAGTSAALNWEGLGWFEEGHKLMLVFDSKRHPPEVAIVDVPEHWK